MHTSYIGIGSNVADAEAMILQACRKLQDEGCEILRTSGIYEVSSPYSNLVARAKSDCTYEKLNAMAKQIEADMGRTREMKPLGIVPIDIDVVVFDGKVTRPHDYEAEYFAKGYREISDI